MTFAKQLRAARKRSKLTQLQAAKLSNVGKRTYEKWEAGVSSPPSSAKAITRERVLAAVSGVANAGSQTCSP